MQTMAKQKESAEIIDHNGLTDTIYSMWIHTETIVSQAKPGQFISVFCKDGSRLLPRPISLCELDKEKGNLRIVYRVSGAGTEEISHYRAGDTIDILGPLGNGFPLSEAEGKQVLLIGGGIGIPPMLETAKQLKNSADVKIILGYRNNPLFLLPDFEVQGRTRVATEDGSAGIKGNVLTCITQENICADIIFACGPTPMLRAVKTFAEENKIECYLSLEEKMACGVGACLACVCSSKEIDAHSHVHNKRVCKDGPVFRAEEVELT